MVSGVSARAGNSIINFCIFIAIKWFLRRQKRQSAADYHYLLVFDKCRNTLIMLVNILIFQHVSDTLNYGKVPY